MSPTKADFIVVGGGTTGITLATRLSEDPKLRVLVLEAGQDLSTDPRVTTPALWPSLLRTNADWNFTSVPQAALNGKTIPYHAGKMLGGTSGINGCAFIANSKSNLDAWEALGNPGWGWSGMVPYYQRSHTLTLPSTESRNKLGLGYINGSENGNSGPIQVSFPDAIEDPIAEAWVQSLRALGFPMENDPFSGSAIGGYTNAATIDPVTKTRSYAGNRYHDLVKARANVEVIAGAHVQQIIFETGPHGDLSATGVQYTVGGQTNVARAGREIIVSAGTFNTPKVLELSGIGRRTLLEQHGIKVQVDNANVGENLQDHVVTGMSFQVKEGLQTKDDLMRQTPEVIAKAMEDYSTRRSGPFTVGGHYSSAMLYVPEFLGPDGYSKRNELLKAYPPPETGTLEDHLYEYAVSCLQNPHEATGSYFSYAAQTDMKSADGHTTKDPDNFITIVAQLLNPLSRGTCHIASSDTAVAPTIDPRWLSHPLDVEIFARHVRFIEDIASSKPLVNFLKPGGKRSTDAPADLRTLPFEELKEWAKVMAKTGYHAVGTCAMLPREKGGVVDSRLRVYGVKNLRIADASIIPIIPRGNTVSTAYAIGEKAADLIKEDLRDAVA